MSFSKSPVYNLKAVLKETGIAADTLRAWERRYGLPLPERTPGGHRLYSEYDIATIKWLMSRQTEGLSISRAVELWKEQTASGADLLPALAPQAFTQSPYVAPETSLDALRAHWLTACLNFNEADAEQTLNEAFAMYPVKAVCTEVLQRGMSEIGSQWYENRASVQQEHFASALAMRRLDSLLSAAPAPTRNGTILVGCAAQEWHTFTPLLLSLFLRRRGWNVIYLGANVPATQFEGTLKMVQADLVVLVAQQLTTAASLTQTTHMLAAHGAQIAFGGRIFNTQPAIIRRVAGTFLGASVEDALEKIESLVTAPAPRPETEAVATEYVTAAATFQSRRPLIEATLHQSIGSLGFGADAMKTATEFLSDNIIAALQLGDIALVDSEIDWVRSLLKSNHIPDQALGGYLNLYADAVNANINGTGKPVVDWLSSVAASSTSKEVL